MAFKEAISKLSFWKSSFKAKGNINVSTSTTVIHYGDQIQPSGPDAMKLLQEHVTFRAFHDSGNRFDPPTCHPETRTAILQSIDSWARNSSTESLPILWLRGAAGAGKSAIVQTSMEKWTSDTLIATSFFFWRTDDQRNHKSHLIPTLAYQLLQKLPAVNARFREAIADGAVFQRTLKSQVETLIVYPFKDFLAENPGTVIMVIDGLDECSIDLPKTDDFPGQDHELQQAEILEAIALACQHIPSLRVLIASRPEHRIRLSFESQYFVKGFLKTHTIPLSLNKFDADQDILLFLQSKFEEIRAQYRGLPISWPSTEQLHQLVGNSSGCFIYPSIAVRYILRRGKAPMESLEAILALHTESENDHDNPLAELDALYQLILKSVSADSLSVTKDVFGHLCYGDYVGGERRNALRVSTRVTKSKSYVQNLRTRFRSLRIFPESITINSPMFFQELLFLTPGGIFYHLTDLHAILDIPDPECGEDHHQIKFAHATFSQYLQDKHRSRDFFIGEQEFHARLLGLYELHIQRSISQLVEVDDKRGTLTPFSHYDHLGLTNRFFERIGRHSKWAYKPTKETLVSLWIAIGPIVKWHPACCGTKHMAVSPWRERNDATQGILRYLKDNLESLELLPEETSVAFRHLQEVLDKWDTLDPRSHRFWPSGVESIHGESD